MGKKMDKIYQWRYSLSSNVLYRSAFDIDTAKYKDIQENYYIKVLYTDSDGSENYELLHQNQIEADIKTINIKEESSLVMYSYSDDPCHAISLFENHLSQIYEDTKKRADIAKKLLADVTTKKAEIELKYSEEKEK